jgi:hypothetical protein
MSVASEFGRAQATTELFGNRKTGIDDLYLVASDVSNHMAEEGVMGAAQYQSIYARTYQWFQLRL